MGKIDAVTIANDAQRKASDPAVSSWVTASAGSGKTTVLTKRVLALLLAGAKPERILCLTFTKAAAAEMANRVAANLSSWVTASDGDLEAELAKDFNLIAGAEDLARARRLFAQVLDAPGGLRIDTLHAFCQSLLRRFPLEAEVSPHFELIEERAAREALHEAREHVIAVAAAGHDPELAQALAVITARVHETNFSDLLAAITSNRAAIALSLEKHSGLAGAMTAIYRTLGARPGDTRESVIADACRDGAFDEVGLMRAGKALAKGGKTDVKNAPIIVSWLKGDRIPGFDAYCNVFLTKERELRKSFATQAVGKADPAVPEILAREAERIYAVDRHLRAVETAETSAALLVLAERILKTYQQHKARLAQLDYDDLIDVTDRLLKQKNVAAWVLFKLDGGIDHVLIDEAQDTNPIQWSIVERLTEEFFAGSGRHEDRAPDDARTVFAVGDRKQSIFGFQGADPEGFLRMREIFAERVTAAQRLWSPVELNVSFRSTEAVLTVVDSVYRDGPARSGVIEADEELVHVISREGHAGHVALWPPMPALDSDTPEPWKPPVDRVTGESAENRLARLLADYIADMIKRGDTLHSKGRAVRPGDIMVLVRRRTAFVDELIRNLKDRAVPVAGVDRMRLSEQIAVMDLVVLGRFLVLPEDDLNLACLLKSPLIGLTEDDLFALAHGRGLRTLWSVMEERGGGSDAVGRAHALLSELLAKADYWTPYHVFAHVLVAYDGRKKLLSRLGLEADDPIDEFLNLALAYQSHHPPSMQAFIHWLDTGDVEIKRDLEHGGDAVRIMTVHGAKGLQAPIVFMPDTMQTPRGRESVFVVGEEDSPVVLWAAPNTARHQILIDARDDDHAAQMREYRRLLYVAMTRAEDRLYVCGWENKTKTPDDCWYKLIERAIEKIGTKTEDPFLTREKTLPSGEVIQYTVAQKAAPVADGLVSRAAEAVPLPEWAAQPPPPEPEPPEPLTPSRPSRTEPAVASPLESDQGQRFQRGLIIHRLLQTLPDLPRERRRDAAEAFVMRPGFGLDDTARRQIVDETLNVLDRPEFAPLFGPGSRAEVPITGMIAGQRLSGQIDRLAVGESDIWVIDYKTNRPPPTSAAQVDEAYVFQMAAYRAALKEIYPAKAIRCVLLWTHGDTDGKPFIIELPADALDHAFAAMQDAASSP
ncbi:MAG: double-strand break repair helicase AddA [Rhodobacteraceae bacterium]|nr:double-strand break repair helicase AddA [Paracoccaceae bacterium]